MIRLAALRAGPKGASQKKYGRGLEIKKRESNINDARMSQVTIYRLVK